MNAENSFTEWFVNAIVFIYYHYRPTLHHENITYVSFFSFLEDLFSSSTLPSSSRCLVPFSALITSSPHSSFLLQRPSFGQHFTGFYSVHANLVFYIQSGYFVLYLFRITLCIRQSLHFIKNCVTQSIFVHPDHVLVKSASLFLIDVMPLFTDDFFFFAVHSTFGQISSYFNKWVS